ncbi:Myb-like DNA-binding domain [Seminavis robusta]|uniref:Myb-like DNA-binding domain n=1 Tax=Seminavis robusta TaxID=568900 RepID=A0A9N8EDQ3_9STRA|nr:Myb-like DNA-binding domain [Seminavis robusta]|eukprot:Sro926_g221020.1 Myb-like DNA-binding domain (541) ;mRNA; f:18883-20670
MNQIHIVVEEGNSSTMALSTLTLPDLAEGHIGDLILHYSYSIVAGILDDKEEMEEHWDALHYFWHNVYPQNKQSLHGRLSNRVKLADIVMMATHVDPYSTTDEATTLPHEKPLIRWNRQDWDLLEEKLEDAHTSLLRRDANNTVNHVDQENPEPHPSRAKYDMYNNEYTRVLKQIHVSRAICPIRHLLEADVNEQKWDFPSIEQEQLEELKSYVDAMDHGRIKKFLEEFLEMDGEEIILNVGKLKAEYHRRPFNFLKLQIDIVALLKDWSEDVFTTMAPPLTQFYAQYESQQHESNNNYQEGDDSSTTDESNTENQPPVKYKKRRARKDMANDKEVDDDSSRDNRKPAAKSSSRRKVQNMQHARTVLGEAVDDPLEATYSVASRAGRSPHNNNIQDDSSQRDEEEPLAKERGSSKKHKGKHKKGRIIDTDEEEEESLANKKRRKVGSGRKKRKDEIWDEDSDGDQKVGLSSLPNHPKAKGPRKQRRFYSSEEKQALREGINEHGVGKWKEILDDHSEVFQGRTSVNLKDLYRTMTKNGEI